MVATPHEPARAAVRFGTAVPAASLLLALAGAILIGVATTSAVIPADQPPVDAGATAWMLTSTALVLLMVPGLAMFYGGLVRTKNVLGTMMHSFAAMAIIGVLWVGRRLRDGLRAQRPGRLVRLGSGPRVPAQASTAPIGSNGVPGPTSSPCSRASSPSSRRP